MLNNSSIFWLIAFLNCTVSCLSAQQFSLVEVLDDASCINFLLKDKNNNTVELPQHISRALECADVADLTAHLLTFIDGQAVKLFDLKRKKEVRLFSMYPDMDGISNPVWSADYSQILFVIINQERKHGYADMARIISLTLDENLAVQSKKKYDRPVHFVCGSSCQSEPYVDFKYTADGIQYRRNENMAVRAGELELVKTQTAR